MFPLTLRLPQGYAYVPVFAPSGLSVSSQTIEPDRSKLDDSWWFTKKFDHELKKHLVGEKRRQIYSDPKQWNETRYGVNGQSFDQETRTLNLRLHLTDFASSEISRGLWINTSTPESDLGKKEYDWSRVLAPVSDTLGINGTLVTVDNQLVLTRRSKFTSIAPNLRHVSMSEGVTPTDGELSANPGAAIRRAAREEHGIPEDISASVITHGWGLNLAQYGWSFFSHVSLEDERFTADYILDLHKKGEVADSWESESIWCVPFTLDTLEKELSNAEEWTIPGWVNLWLTALYAFPELYDRVNYNEHK